MITFDKRELPEGADSVSPEKLTIGDTYFKVSYADEGMTIPLMDSVTYIGRNLVDDDEDTLYFQCTFIYGAHPPHPYWALR